MIPGCLSKRQVEEAKQLLDETATSERQLVSKENVDKGTIDTSEAPPSDYLLDSVFNCSPSYLPLIDQVSLKMHI